MNTNKLPLISVIIPVYNSAEFLTECLSSICNQTYKNIEIIIVNDGSTDSSLSICTRFSITDSRILIVNKDNSGVSSSRNKGLNIASGEYIAFIDSDDYVTPSYIELLYCSLTKNDVDISICAYTRIQSGKHNTDHSISNITLLSRDNLYYYVLCNNNIGGYLWNKLFVKSIISNNQIHFNTELTIGEDMLFISQYLLHCKSGFYTPISLYYYRLNTSSALNSMHTSHEFDSNKASNLDAAILINIELNNENSKIRSSASYRQVRTAMWLIFNIVVCNYYNKTMLLKIKKTIRKNLKFYLLNQNSKLLEKACAILIYISPTLFVKTASLIYKSPLSKLSLKYLN